MAGRVKGAPVRDILRWHEAEVGPARIRTIGASLRPELATFVDLDAEALGIQPSSWYPGALAHALLPEVFGELEGPARAAVMREAMRSVLRASGRGVYHHVLARLATPSMLASSIQRLWTLLFDDGERSMVRTSEGTIESRTRSWSGHGPDTLLCEIMSETSAAILETMGKRDVRTERIACVASGAPECVVRYRWSE